MIEYFFLLLLVNREVSNAMEADQAPTVSLGWESRPEQGRALLSISTTTTQPPLISPVPPRHSRINHSLVAAIVVLMILATGAIFCCCYVWEQQLRLRTQAARSTAAQSDDTRSSSNSLQQHQHHPVGTSPQMNASPSNSVIVFLGDGIPRSVAWTIPQGNNTPAVAPATNSTMAEPALRSIPPANSDQPVGKLANSFLDSILIE